MALSKNEKEIYDLLICFFENDINDEQREKLLVWSQSVPNASKVYWRFAKDLAIIRTQIAGQIQIADDTSEDTKFDQEIWLELAEYEKTAPEIVVPKEKPQRELIQKVVYPTKDKRKLNTFSKVFLALNAAAILFFFLLLRIAPPNGGSEVATLTDSINAKWADAADSMEKGTRLTTRSDELFLREGLAELVFDNNVKVVIEGPAEFELITKDQIDLQYGRIYATVPRDAIGFTVSTPTSRIIDLGTEFGVQADAFGDVQLHVIKGKTTLIAGDRSNRINVEVSQGQAKQVSGTTQNVSDIPCQKELFVRTIDSKEKLVWKGRNQISLTDIVGGGNGLGTGRWYTGINPITGQTTSTNFENRKATNEYRPVASNPLIDGVFVPNGRTEQIISSMDHVFQECPITKGDLWTDIVSMPISSGKEWKPEGIFSNRGQLAQGANLDSTEERLVMHANLGITFDLRAIRSILPDVKVARFRSQFGLAPFNEEMNNADFWILVDGKLKFKQTQVKERGRAGLIDIELSDTDRFLTLVTTDGGDPEERFSHGKRILPINGDWCVFVEPSLILE